MRVTWPADAHLTAHARQRMGDRRITDLASLFGHACRAADGTARLSNPNTQIVAVVDVITRDVIMVMRVGAKVGTP